MTAFFSFVKSWLLRMYASLVGIHPRVIDRFVLAGNPLYATRLVDHKFDWLAPKEERVAAGDWFKGKWGFVEAARFLLKCRPRVAAAVLNQYFNGDMFQSSRHKPRVLMELWLTLPFFNEDAETREKVDRIITLVARSNDKLIGNLLEEGQAKPAFELVSRIKEKEVPKAMRFVPVETGAFLLGKLRRSDPDWFEELFGKLDARYAENVLSHWNRQEFLRREDRRRDLVPTNPETDPEGTPP